MSSRRKHRSLSEIAKPVLDLEYTPSSLHTNHIPGSYASSLAKRGTVYGPAINIPVGEFFCPALDTEEGITCKQAYDAMVCESGSDVKRKDEIPTPAFMLDERGSDQKTKNVRACERTCDISTDYPPSGEIQGKDWGWVDPKSCSNFDFGKPLQERAINITYHTERGLRPR
jgi:chitinase